VGAKYKNKPTGEWEDVLFEVDAAANELIIYTDHLSTFGVFHIKNEGQRSAKITNIYADFTGIDQQQAMETLREYVAGGGADGEEAAGLAAQLLTGYNGFLGGVAGAAGETGFATDLTGTILNMASLGSPTFDTALADSAYKKLNKLGKVAAAVKIGAVMLSTEKTDADTLGLYKDTAMFALSFAESAAWGLAASGLFIFDYTISSMFEQGLAMKMDKIDEVYVYFNDEYISKDRQGFQWTARSLKDWRQVLIDIAEANPNEADAKAAVEAEIERYARVFRTLNSADMGVIVSEMKEKNSKSSVTIPTPTEAEMKTLVDGYKAQLYERLYPVTQSVSVYMQRKAEAAYLAALDEVKAFFNQSITFNIVEDVPDGEKSQYDGYALRFAPLSENAVKESWIGAMKGRGGASTKFTLLGYVQAGCPKELQLFKPGDDPESDEPELTVGFKLSAPVTEVKLGGLPLEELLGTYSVTFPHEDGDETYRYTFMFYEGQLGFRPDDGPWTALALPSGPYEYAPATATATCELKSEDFSVSANVNFVSEGGMIHLSSAVTVVGKKTVTTYGDGTKID
jgi:putative transposon-encoded protein